LASADRRLVQCRNFRNDESAFETATIERDCGFDLGVAEGLGLDSAEVCRAFCGEG
jgi:hypothetical protein